MVAKLKTAPTRLSLVPEFAASAKESVHINVIGADAWSFCNTVCIEAVKRFPTLAGEPNSRINSIDANTASPDRTSPGRSPAVHKPAFKGCSMEEFPGHSHAPFSCKYWLDGILELDPIESIDDWSEQQTKSTHKTSTCSPESSKAGAHTPRQRLETEDASVTPSSKADLSQDDSCRELPGELPGKPGKSSVRSLSSLGSIASVPPDEAEEVKTISERSLSTSAKNSSNDGVAILPTEPTLISSDASKASGNSAASRKRRRKEREKKIKQESTYSSIVSRKSLMSLTSARSKFGSVLSFFSNAPRSSAKKQTDDWGDNWESEMDNQRTVVRSNFFPVEKFSDEIAMCKNLEEFTETVMLFLIDSRNEEANFQEQISNLNFRKHEVERWMQASENRHKVSGAPSMLCVVLVHKSDVSETKGSEATPRSSEASPKAALENSNDYSTTVKAICAPGKTETSYKSAGHGIDEEELQANCDKLVDEIRKLLQLPMGDQIQFNVNFNDAEALLRFVVAVTEEIIDRRKNCSISNNFFQKDSERSSKSSTKGSKCPCSCVVA